LGLVVRPTRALTVALARTAAAGVATTAALVVPSRAGASSARTWTLPTVVKLASVVLLALAGLQAGTATATV